MRSGDFLLIRPFSWPGSSCYYRAELVSPATNMQLALDKVLLLELCPSSLPLYERILGKGPEVVFSAALGLQASPINLILHLCSVNGIYMHTPSPNIFLTFFITDLSSWLFIFFGLLSIWQPSITLVITLDITTFKISISISKCNQYLCLPPGVRKKKNPQCLNIIPTKLIYFCSCAF